MQSRSRVPGPTAAAPSRTAAAPETLGRRQPSAVPDRGAAPDGGRDACCEVQVVHLAQVARARAALPATVALDASAALLRALGDRTRLQIVVALAAAEELCVCDLAAVVGVSQSAVSHSLRTLRQLRVVGYRKDGQIAYYALDAAWRASPLGAPIVAGALWPRTSATHAAATHAAGDASARTRRRRSAAGGTA